MNSKTWIAQALAVAALSLCEAFPAHAQIQYADPAVETLLSNGDPSSKLDFVIVANGYTASEMTLYASHCRSVLELMFLTEPFASAKGAFNIYKVNTIGTLSDPEERTAASRAPAKDFIGRIARTRPKVGL